MFSPSPLLSSRGFLRLKIFSQLTARHCHNKLCYFHLLGMPSSSNCAVLIFRKEFSFSPLHRQPASRRKFLRDIKNVILNFTTRNSYLLKHNKLMPKPAAHPPPPYDTDIEIHHRGSKMKESKRREQAMYQRLLLSWSWCIFHLLLGPIHFVSVS